MAKSKPKLLPKPKFPSGFSKIALEICNALDQGRTEDAKRIAAKHLRRYGDPVLDIVAEMLLAKRKQGSGRKVIFPPHWFEIGKEGRELQADGDSYEEATEKLARAYGYSETTIRATRAFFEKVQRKETRWWYELSLAAYWRTQARFRQAIPLIRLRS